MERISMKVKNIVKNTKLIILLVACICLIPIQASANTDVKAKQAIDEAEKSLKKASSVDGEWRDSGKILKAAGDALKSGDYAKAIKLANKANRQGKLGYEQAVAQKELKMPPYWK
jgi:cell division protein FtsL